MILEWWHWAILGIAIALLELAVPAFYALWFGMGALVVALALLVAPGLSLTVQLGLWTAASVAMVVLWFRVFRRGDHKTRLGTSGGEVIGEVGLLVGSVAPFERGRVRFQRPVLGAEEWVCLAETAIPAGERVKVVAIEGSFLKVAKA